MLLFCRRGATPVVGVKIKDDILSASLEVKVHSGTTVIGGRYSKTPVPDPGPLQVALVEGFPGGGDFQRLLGFRGGEGRQGSGDHPGELVEMCRARSGSVR